MLLYIDDILIVAKSMSEVNKLKTLLYREFDMKDLCTAKKIIGMEIHRDRDTSRLQLSQYSYIEKLLERFNMDNAKPMSIPLANHFRLSNAQCLKTDDEMKDTSKVPYTSIVRCLMYDMVCTILDLACAVSVVRKFISNPGRQHWDVVKWIFKYLKGTIDYGIMFSKQQGNPSVVGYINAYYTGDLDDMRSITSYEFTLVGEPIC